MRCPHCEATGTRVIDSRDLEGGSTIRRRRECETCAHRFTTYERPEGARLVVMKRDGSRQDFDREKLRAGLLKALQKRPVTLDRVEAAVDDIEAGLRARGESEVPSTEIGRLATEALRELDQLASASHRSITRTTTSRRCSARSIGSSASAANSPRAAPERRYTRRT
jgi:transcriptional repressor NrdR